MAGPPSHRPTLSGLRQWSITSVLRQINPATVTQAAGAALSSLRSSRGALAGAVVGCLALATIAGTPANDVTGGTAEAAGFTLREESGGQASRSHDRTAAPAEAGLLTIDPKLRAEVEAQAAAAEAQRQAEAQAAAQAAAAEEARRAEEARIAAANAQPVPVAGLSQVQMNNAKHIVVAGQEMGLPKRAMVIAIATSLQESQLHNLASTVIPESYNYTNEGQGSDHDSVGLFQQRPSAGWGSVPELMNPNYSAKAFYNGLVRVGGWDSMPLTYAAQAVQVSAFPEAYAKHEGRAQQIADALAP